jgi:hypothetical protein
MQEYLCALLHEYGRPLAAYCGRGQPVDASGTAYQHDFVAAALKGVLPV